MLDSSYNPSQIWVQSTGIERTLQSGYSELLGLYPPKTQKNVDLQTNRKLQPPMKIRESVKKAEFN